ncbi:MAG: methyltransferase domain-containing protein [bacterium]|nr:methyltransferase domain-containing protein [bacterium]
MSLTSLLIVVVLGVTLLRIVNIFEYQYLKNKIFRRQKWDLNICSGKTNGGGVNADIVEYGELPNFVLLTDIYHLPFTDKQFKTVLCSHTLEHVDDPDAFFKELQRVGEEVVVVLPPVWDIGAALNFFEHKWIFLCVRTEHRTLPKRIRLPFAAFYHKYFGQVMHA